jgi:TonB-dependent receptor
VFGAAASVLVLGAASARAEATTDASTAAAAGSQAGGGAAAKPDAPSQTVQEVVVTGFRSSLAKAVSIKRKDNSEVDTILAEDIGKFPDLNLAESLQRIPGVAITRQGGEGRQITVRGLGPQYTRVRIDGMEALTTTGGPDQSGGVNRTRNFDFNIFASDLFNQLTARKTGEADVDEGSLGATIDLRSAHPFDFNRLTFIATAKGDHNTLSGAVDPRLSFIASDTFFGGTVGALVSASYARREILDDGSSTVRWDEGQVLATGTNPYGASPYGFGSVLGTHCTGTAATLPAICQTADSALHPRFPRYDFYRENTKRIGTTVSLQWRPNDNHLFTFDWLHSYFGGTRQEQYLEQPGLSGQAKCTNPSNTVSIGCINVLSETIDGQGVMTAASLSGVDTRVEDRYDQLHTTFDQATLSGQHRFFGGRLLVDEMVGASVSNFANPIQTTLGWDQYNQSVSYDFANRIPMLNFGSENVGITGPWLLTSVRERPQTTLNKFNTAEINGHFTAFDWLKLHAGLQYKEYGFNTTSSRLVNGETVSATNAYKSLQAIPISQYGQTLNFGGVSGVTTPAGSTTSWATPNVLAAASVMGLYTNPLFAVSTTGDLGNNAMVTERDYGGYLQADWDLHLLSRPFRGNIGIRAVETNQSSQGYSFINNVLGPVQASRSYGNALPSLNMVWEVRDDAQVRFSAGRAMSRPNLTDLVGSTSVTISGTQLNVKTGNPNLNPFLANAYDLAYEWYPQRGALVSLALFHKDILNQVVSQPSTQVFHGNSFGIPDSAAVGACTAAGVANPSNCPNLFWSFSAPVNSPGGPVNGVEINYQQPLTFLPGVLKHTGLLLNFTAVDSKVQFPTGAKTGPAFVTNQLLGLSRSSANATIYYEDSKWSARVSGAYRSKYLTRVPGQEVGTDADGVDSTFNLDTSIQYTVTPHVKLTLEGLNLTNQYENWFNDTSRNLPTYYHQVGREILFGVRYQY